MERAFVNDWQTTFEGSLNDLVGNMDALELIDKDMDQQDAITFFGGTKETWNKKEAGRFQASRAIILKDVTKPQAAVVLITKLNNFQQQIKLQIGLAEKALKMKTSKL